MSIFKSINNKISSIKGTCVNIGCGDDIRSGWINCDLFPKTNSVRRFDIRSSKDLAWLASLNSELIESNHVIGYLNYAQAYNFFKSCYSSLKQSGKLILEFPDITKISNKVIEMDSNLIDRDCYIELMRAIYAYDIDDAYDEKFDMQTYVFGWSGSFISQTLEEIGFNKIYIKLPEEHSKRTWRDTRVEAVK